MINDGTVETESSESLSAIEKSIRDVRFMKDKADHPFAEIAYGMAIAIMEMHSDKESSSRPKSINSENV